MTDHYDRLGDLYAELGALDGDLLAIGNRDFTGWYRSKPVAGEWDGQARPWALGREWASLRDGVDRVVYATVSYAPAEWFADAWTPFNYRKNERGRDWATDDSPTPGYGGLGAYAPFADIDLADDVKSRRPEGDIPQDAIERALGRYIDAFADLAGRRDHVFALDSVGGAYVFIAPSATAPIATAFEPADRALIFDDLMGRLNDWLAEVRDSVNEAVPEVAGGVFKADLVNNKNRLYKAPLSLHKSLDGVVTPVDTRRPAYAFTPLAAVDDALRAEAEGWAERFTANHREAVESIVATLWPGEYSDADGWRDAIAARIGDLKAERARHRERQAAVEAAGSNVPEDIEETDDLDVLKAAIEAIDVQDLARRLAVEWDTAPGRDPPRFAPPWRTTASGTSCYADRDKWVDLAEGKGGGGPLKLVARARGIIGDSSDDLRGEDYWRAVNALRAEGFDIPYFTGRDGRHYDGLRLYERADGVEDQRAKALRAALADDRRG